MPEESKAFLVVIGAGPGGYPAAFHAADLGMDVVMIDERPRPGGVCLYEGCIPSKSILHASGAIQLSKESEAIGISFEPPKIDLPKLREWKQSVVDRLTDGLSQLTQERNVRYLQGHAEFVSKDSIKVMLEEGGEEVITFEHAILASGSEPVQLPFLPGSDLVMDSSSALALDALPDRLLVIGGGYIGLELGQAYASLGVEVSVLEAMPYLLANVDRDLVRPLAKNLERQFERIMLKTTLTSAEEQDGKLKVTFEGPEGDREEIFEKMLVAVGRRPSTSDIGLDAAGVKLGDDGFVAVDEGRFTANPSIQAIGDVAGQPMLAHKATHEGRSAAEALSDGETVYEPMAVPAVIFTDPEIAWCGLTEDEARRSGRAVRVGKFPWQASGRAVTLGRQDGLTKVVADEQSGEVLGVGMSGESAAEMIGEATLAIEMGAVAEDIALTIHPHPTLSETLMEAAQRCMTDSSTHFLQRQ